MFHIATQLIDFTYIKTHYLTVSLTPLIFEFLRHTK